MELVYDKEKSVVEGSIWEDLEGDVVINEGNLHDRYSAPNSIQV